MKLETLKTLLFVICVILLLPVILPWAMITTSIDDRRKRRLAEQTRCVCGTVLGMPALKLNSEAWAATVAEAEARYPGSRINYGRLHDAICATCGQWYLYESKPPRFVAVEKPEGYETHSPPSRPT